MGFISSFYLLLSADLAFSRVQERVSRGGHDVPEQIVRRRFDRSMRTNPLRNRNARKSCKSGYGAALLSCCQEELQLVSIEVRPLALAHTVRDRDSESGLGVSLVAAQTRNWCFVHLALGFHIYSGSWSPGLPIKPLLLGIRKSGL